MKGIVQYIDSLTIINMENYLLVVGGGISWLVLTVLNFVRKNTKFKNTKESIELEIKNNPYRKQVYGEDLDAYITDILSIKKAHFIDEIIRSGMKPLLILGFVSLFYKSTFLGIIISILIFLMSIGHEFLVADKVKINRWCILYIIVFWVIFSIIFMGNPFQVTSPVNV